MSLHCICLVYKKQTSCKIQPYHFDDADNVVIKPYYYEAFINFYFLVINFYFLVISRVRALWLAISNYYEIIIFLL
jgi:hypothetical protein